eukprot:Gb_30433 [translate_table: standard]
MALLRHLFRSSCVSQADLPLSYSIFTSAPAFAIRRQHNNAFEPESEEPEVPSSGRSRPLADILRELSRRVPEKLIKVRVEDGFSIKYVPCAYAILTMGVLFEFIQSHSNTLQLHLRQVRHAAILQVSTILVLVALIYLFPWTMFPKMSKFNVETGFDKYFRQRSFTEISMHFGIYACEKPRLGAALQSEAHPIALKAASCPSLRGAIVHEITLASLTF